MSATEQEYKNHIKELEQQVRLLKEQVDFLTLHSTNLFI